MKIFREIADRLLYVAVIALIAIPLAYAANNYAATEGAGKTFGCVDVTGVCYPLFIPADGGGVKMTDDTNHRLNTNVNIADGADVTKGAEADAACGTDTGTCTLIALVKRWLQTATTINTNIQTGTATNGATYPGSSIGIGWKDGSGNIQPSAAATPMPVGMYGGTTAVTVKAASTPPATTDTATVTVLRPATSMTPIVAAASDNHAVVKNGAGVAFSIHASNNSATANYARLYDAGTGFNGCNSATGVIFAFGIPPSNSGFSISLGGSRGLAFTNGLSYCITSGFGLTDTTNATASAIFFNVSYN